MEQKGGAHFLNVGIIIYWPNLTGAVFTLMQIADMTLFPEIFFILPKFLQLLHLDFFFPLYNYLNYIFDKNFKKKIKKCAEKFQLFRMLGKIVLKNSF